MAQASDQAQDLSRAAQIFLISFNHFLGWSIALTLSYFAIGLQTIPVYLITSVAIISAIFFIFQQRSNEQRTRNNGPATRTKPVAVQSPVLSSQFRVPKYTWLFSLVTITIDVFLLIIMLQLRTDAPLVSPWQLLTTPHFLLFFLSGLFLILASVNDTGPLKYLAFITQTAVMWLVSVILYAIGFGFDPFIHRAAENTIVTQGKILPIQFMYTGQYIIVSTASLLTHISVQWIDKLLVPLAAAILIPCFYWLSQPNKKTVGLLAIFLLPLPFLAFTIPFNLAALLLIITLILSRQSNQPSIQITMGLSATLTLLIHPLIGIPHLLFVIAVLVKKKLNPKIIVISLIITVPVALFMALAIYSAMQHAPATIPSTIDFYHRLLSLFANPHTDSNHPLLTNLYRFVRVWPLLFVCIGLMGYMKQSPSKNQLLVAAGIGTFLGSCALGLFFWIPNIIAREQYEFALRLQQIAPIFFFPGVAYWLQSVLDTHQILKMKLISVAIILPIIMTAVWYITYPQYNALVNQTAPSVSAQDIEIVKNIHIKGENEPYIVLSPQMLAAAALHEFDFKLQVQSSEGKINSYAIPTGGMLYTEYMKCYQAPQNCPQIIKKLFNKTQAHHLFVVIPTSWDPWDRLQNEITPHTARIMHINDQSILQFDFKNRP